MLTLPNALDLSEDEYNIAALLSDASIRKVVEIQAQLHELLGDAIWLAPSNCLHITLMEIICNVDYGEVSRKQLFSDWYAKYAAIAGEVIGQYSPFTLEFNELHASPEAIIIKASDPSPLNDIRHALLSRTTLPRGTKQPPDIGHSTIARFKEAIEFEVVQNAIASIQVEIKEPIKAFKLVEGLGPPRLNPEELMSYSLAND